MNHVESQRRESASGDKEVCVCVCVCVMQWWVANGAKIITL